MKKLLLLLFIGLSFAGYGQTTVILNADTASIFVGAYEHPKNTLRAKYSDSGMAVIGTDNTVFAADRKYNTYTNGATSLPFASFADLKAWVKENFFVDASNGEAGGGNLQQTTDAGNTSSNAISITGSGGLSLDSSSLSFAKMGSAGVIFNIDSGALKAIISFNEPTFGNGIRFTPNGVNNNGLILLPTTSTDSLIGVFSGRISASNAKFANEVITLGQVQGMLKGGQSMFTANGTDTVFNITHNLGAIPSYFELSTTTPINLNQLNRTITFPDLNTMRVTFNTAPLVGEIINYVWVVYR